MLPSWVSSWCYQQMLDQTGKFLTGANTLAYLASSSATKKKCFIILTLWCHDYKTVFTLSVMKGTQMSHKKPFHIAPIFAGEACGLYHYHIMIINDAACVVSK